MTASVPKCKKIEGRKRKVTLLLRSNRKIMLHQNKQLGQSWRKQALIPHNLCKSSQDSIGTRAGGGELMHQPTRGRQRWLKDKGVFWSFKLKKFSGSDRFWENVGTISTLPVPSLWGKATKCQQTHSRLGFAMLVVVGVGTWRVNVAQEKYKGKIRRVNLRRQDKHNRARA